MKVCPAVGARILALLLLVLPAVLHAASLNGFDVADSAATATDAKSAPAAHEVVLLAEGLRAIALEASAAGEPPAGWFAARGFLLVGNVGPDAALLARLPDKYADPPLAARVHRLAPENRMAPDVREARGKTTTDAEAALVVFLAGPSGDAEVALRAALPRAEVTAAEKGPLSRIGVRVAAADAPRALDVLSARPEVYSIQRGGGARLLNVTARRIVQSGSSSFGGETLWARGLHGNGQICATLDTGLDPQSCFFAETDGSFPPVVEGTAPTAGDLSRRKVIVYDMLHEPDDAADGLPAYESHGHGTWVAGNALGSKLGGEEFSANDSVVNGVAPGARLVVQDGGAAFDNCADLPALGCPVIDLTDILDQAYAQGARLHNNSWGDRENFNPQNTYTAVCADMDDAAWRNPDFLIVCAAGNSSGLGEGSVGSPSVAKNVLSVAGTENPNADTIISFSSIGWADDGRFKPDICAPARTVTPHWSPSATAVHCSTTTVQGTSMASPITMGSLAIIREYFEEGWYPSGTATPAHAHNPGAALLKAVLVAGAFQLPTQPAAPSRRQGWGRVHIENSLYFAGETRRLIVRDSPAVFASAADAPVEFQIAAGGDTLAGDLRIVLVWTDYPATAGANPALVNDLDLEVEGPGATLYRGNALDSTTGRSIDAGPADTINNVEVVRLEPAAATYTVRVRPANILQPPQGFALAITGDAVETTASAAEHWRELR